MQPELLFEYPSITVRRVFVSEMNNAVYLLTSRDTGARVLIDPADSPAMLTDLIESSASDSSGDRGVELIAITHAHGDHTRAVSALEAQTGANICIGRSDAPRLLEERDVLADRLLDGGEILAVGDFRLECVGLAGHTPGSIAYLYRDGADAPLLFSGDSLFPGGLGNTEGDAARFGRLYQDVQQRIFDVLPDETVVLPGHGEMTTLGAERPSLAEWRRRGW